MLVQIQPPFHIRAIGFTRAACHGLQGRVNNGTKVFARNRIYIKILHSDLHIVNSEFDIFVQNVQSVHIYSVIPP